MLIQIFKLKNPILKIFKMIINLYYYYKNNELGKLKEVDVLFVSSDQDLPYLYKGKRYSPLIHSIYEDLDRLELKIDLISIKK